MSESESVICLFKIRDRDAGVIRLEQWPEGFVLWAGGEIRWRSWQREPPRRDPTEAFDGGRLG